MEKTEERFCFLIKHISLIEQQLEILRQELNQQPLFNFEDLFSSLATDQLVNAYDLQNFAKKTQGTIPVLQSIIQMYNANESACLKKKQLGIIFSSRKNHVLARLVEDRPSYGMLQPEIKKLCIQIIELQMFIHSQIVKFRTGYNIQSILKKINNEIYVDIPKLQLILESNGINIKIQNFIEYINSGSKSYSILLKRIHELLIQSNCKILKQFLTQSLPPKNINPLIDERFHNLLRTPKTINCFGHRQKRSIQSHLTRINCKRRFEVYGKLSKYRKLIQEEVMTLVKALKDILYLQKQIQYTKMELSLCTDFYPRLFFESYELDKNQKIIPSSMKHHLELFNLNFDLSEIYHLFKRYSGEDGKLTYLEFQSIFSTVQRQYTLILKNNKIVSLNQVSVQAKRLYLQALSTIINNQTEIFKIKSILYHRKHFDIKNIFSCIDNDEDGCISILDFQVLIKKYASLELSKLDKQLLAHRFGKSSIQNMICYSDFVLELTPKSPVSLSKCKSCNFEKQY